MKKEEKPKHHVNIGTLGHVDRTRPSLVKLIIDSIDENGKIKTNNDADKQSSEKVHKGIEIKK